MDELLDKNFKDRHSAIVDCMNELSDKYKEVEIILSNVCGDGYDAYERAYEITKHILPLLEKEYDNE